MAHEILSVKLCELDEKFARMHSRIQLSETENPTRLETEIEALKKECDETELTIRGSLERSKASVRSELLGAYAKIEEIVHQTLKEPAELGDAESYAEKQLLLAEYELDFTMLAANRALLIALKAIETQLSQEKLQLSQEKAQLSQENKEENRRERG